jgi:hypothetical protein
METSRLIRGLRLVALLACIGRLWAATYYVRPDGDDSRNGQSDTNAWASIAQVRAFAWDPGFTPGDSILFKGGETHTCTDDLYMQADKCSGTAAVPVTIGSYGSGRATIRANACHFIFVWAPSAGTVQFALRVENLNITGNGQPKTGPKSALGIQVWSSSATPLDMVHIENCDISGFAGDGLAMGRDDKTRGRIKNVVVRNVKAYDNPGAAGVSPHSGSGIIVAGAAGALIEHCIAYNNGINNNNSGGPIGIWFWDCINSTIQFCESYNNRTTKGDGGGFDLDGGCQNCIIQYCYSHGNAGAGYLMAQFGNAYQYYGPLENNTIRYNISQKDGRKGSFGAITFWGAGGSDYVGTTHIYNNTIYLGGTPDAGSPSCVKFLGSSVSGIKIRNNIFAAADGHQIINSGTAFDTTKVLFQGNCYHAAAGNSTKIKWGGTTHSSLVSWQATGQEKLKGANTGILADPLLADPGNGGTIGNTADLATLAAYKLQTGSPLRDKGLDLTILFGIDAGTRDFWDNIIPQGSAPEIGAYELAPETGILSIPVNRYGRRLPGLNKTFDLFGRDRPGTAGSSGILIQLQPDGRPEKKMKIQGRRYF